MSYIGRGIDQIDNISTLDNLTFNGSDATFNLTQNSVAFVPVSADALQIQIDGVIQSGNYTVSGSTVTFDFTPSGSSVCNGIRHYGVGLLTTVSDSSITTAKLGTDSVNGSKIADDSISDEHLDITAITGQTAITSLADTDKFLVSDASDSGNLKYVENQYLGGSEYIKIANNSGTNNVGGAFINDCFSTTYRTYLVTFQFENNVNGNQIWLRFLKDDDSEISVAKYRYATHQINNGGTESSITANDSSYWRMTGGTAGGNTALFGGCFGFMYVHNPYTIASGQAGAGNLYRTGWNAHYHEYDDSGGVSNMVSTGMLEQNSDNVAGIQFMPSANYIAKRNITVWGLKEY